MEEQERGGEKKENKQTNPPRGRGRATVEAAGAPTPAEARPGTGQSIQPGSGAHGRAASSARPRRTGFSPGN